ncbi:MAG: hypothetical protein U9O94_07530 [Nanoarchaeota archaeon]|nr:hypothetical protein [Nanoarchaeota archaeon]
MKKSTIFYSLIALFLIILLFGPHYNSWLLNTGIYFTGGTLTMEDIQEGATGTNTLFAKEGLYGSVYVDEKKPRITTVKHEGIGYRLKINESFFGNIKVLKIDGKTQCGTGRVDTVTTGLLGGLPVILGKKGDALNIGLGCALTLGVLERGDFKNIDTIEIDPVVIEASSEFNDVHNRALEDPRSNMIIDDARNYLLKTDKKYDVIVNEPSHPYSIGNSNLITREFFLMMKEHLNEGGIVIQWVPISQITSCDKPGFAIFYKTLSSVFPYNYVFTSKAKIPNIQPYIDDSDGKINARYNEIYNYSNPQWKYGETILVGSLKPIDIEKYLDDFTKSKSRIKKHFERIRIPNLEDYYTFSNKDVLGFSHNVELNTDNNPIIEFLAAKNLHLSKELDCEVQQGIEFKKQ